MSIVRKIRKAANMIVRQSYWFKEVCFSGCSKFWSYNKFNTKIVNLGSTSSLYAFNYEDLNVKAANWAIARNPIVGDLAILKNYYSFLEPNKSIVLLPICPFSSLSGRYDYLDDRYYTFLYPSSIPYFSNQRLNKIMEIYNNPLRYYPIAELFAIIVRLFKKKEIILSEKQMEIDAKIWYNNWLKEFSINSFSEGLSLLNKDSISEYCVYINEIIDFCEERNLSIYVVIPPVYKTLRDKFDEQACFTLFSDIYNVAQNRNVKILDYFKQSEFSANKVLFKNSFLMNKEGAKVFTQKVLEDLQVI